jgi:hypothetical protein
MAGQERERKMGTYCSGVGNRDDKERREGPFYFFFTFLITFCPFSLLFSEELGCPHTLTRAVPGCEGVRGWEGGPIGCILEGVRAA